MTTSYGNILEKGSRFKKLLAISATALIASVALADPSWAEVRTGNSIIVSPASDTVGADGNYAGNMTIEVLRNNVVIGTATGPAVRNTRTGTWGLEVNGEAPDCWSNFTPDILPGDTIRVTDEGGVPGAPGVPSDTMVVADVAVTSQQPTLDANGNVVVEGTAVDANGNPFLLDGTLVADWRVQRPRALGDTATTPNTLEYLPNGTTWRATYRVNQQQAASPDAAHSISYTAGGALANEITTAELGAAGGPGLGCETIAPKATYSVVSSNPAKINNANITPNGITLTGASFDASAVSVELADQSGGTVVKDGTITPATGGQTWTASFAEDEVRGLADGKLTATATYTIPNPDTTVGGTVTITGVNLTIDKDVVPPTVGAVSLADASNSGDKTDTLTNDATPTFNGTAEAGSTVEVFDGATSLGKASFGAGDNWSFEVPQAKALGNGARQIKAVATDATGNSTSSAVLDITIDTLKPRVNATPGGTFKSAPSVSLTLVNAAQETDTRIFYTRDGTTPDDTATPYTGQFAMSGTLKYIAIDKAGNSSDIGTQVYNIDSAAPRVSAKSPKANAKGVSIKANVKATFNEAVKGVSGATFTLKQGAKAISAKVTLSGNTAILNPKANLVPGKKYTVRLTSGISDGVGNRLAATSWSFTTR